MRLGDLFTRQERLALGFLIGAGLFGMAVQWFWPARPGAGFFVSPSPVSVNRAGFAELVALPGIGPVVAKRISEDRKRRGAFLTMEDLKRVKGISAKTLQNLHGLVRFD